MTASATDREPTLAERLKVAVLAAIERFESSEGRSADQYHDDVTYHPMADAKYLLTIATLRDAGVISEDFAAGRVRASVTRLEASFLAHGDQRGWGLGFAWGDAPADLAYTITTAIVTHGLWVAVEPEHGVLRSAVDALRSVPLLRSDPPVPQFSPAHKQAIVNAVAYWAGARALVDDDAAEAVATLEWVAERFAPGAGWAYADGTPRFDLLHQWYTIGGQALAHGWAAVESRALEVAHRFWVGDAAVEKFDLVPLADALKHFERATDLALVLQGEIALVRWPQRASAWAIGELCASLGALAASGRQRDHWVVFARRAALRSLTDHPTHEHHRALMHLAHGWAAILAALRTHEQKS